MLNLRLAGGVHIPDAKVCSVSVELFMKRAVSVILPLVLFVVIPAAFAQDGNDAAPQIPVTQSLGSYLVSWSEMQYPEPVPAQTSPSTPSQAPAPEPRPETPAPKDQSKPSAPDQGAQSGQPGASSQPQGPDNAQAEPAAQTFTGTISKEGDSI